MSFYETTPADSDKYLLAARMLFTANEQNQELFSRLIDVVNSMNGWPLGFPPQYQKDFSELQEMMRRCFGLMEHLGAEFERIGNGREYHSY
jgi:hypothetical protein